MREGLLDNLDRLEGAFVWGAAEQIAIDRCLSVQGLSAFRPKTPPRLSRTIEAEIIPRLLLAHLPDANRREDLRTPPIGTVEVMDFTRLLLECSVDAVLRQVSALQARGYPLDSILLDLFAPTARLLGDMWVDDLCSFTDVTIGLARLQQTMRELCGPLDPSGPGTPQGHVLLTAVPGEQHGFGVSMLEVFFQKAGWDVRSGGPWLRGELLEIAAAEWLDVIGLSLSSDILYDGVDRLIGTLRRASRNPAVYIMVGGRYFLDHPEGFRVVGADAVAVDAPDALRQASSRPSVTLARC